MTNGAILDHLIFITSGRLRMRWINSDIDLGSRKRDSSKGQKNVYATKKVRRSGLLIASDSQLLLGGYLLLDQFCRALCSGGLFVAGVNDILQSDYLLANEIGRMLSCSKLVTQHLCVEHNFHCATELFRRLIVNLGIELQRSSGYGKGGRIQLKIANQVHDLFFALMNGCLFRHSHDGHVEIASRNEVWLTISHINPPWSSPLRMHAKQHSSKAQPCT